MALNLDKLVQDAKKSGSAKQAVVFLVQNIATLINDAANDAGRAKELMAELNARAQDMADSVVDNRDVTPPAPHADTEESVLRAKPHTAGTNDGPHPVPKAKREEEVPKPRLK